MVIMKIMIGYRLHVIVAQVFTTCDVIRLLFQKNAFLFFIAVFACYSVCIRNSDSELFMIVLLKTCASSVCLFVRFQLWQIHLNCSGIQTILAKYQNMYENM